MAYLRALGALGIRASTSLRGPRTKTRRLPHPFTEQSTLKYRSIMSEGLFHSLWQLIESYMLPSSTMKKAFFGEYASIEQFGGLEEPCMAGFEPPS